MGRRGGRGSTLLGVEGFTAVKYDASYVYTRCMCLSAQYMCILTYRYMCSTLQIQGIKRFACQTRLLQMQNACKRCAKRVYYKRKTRVNAALNACKRSAKRVYYKRKTRLLHAKRVCWKRVLRDQSRQLESQGCGSLA